MLKVWVAFIIVLGVVIYPGLSQAKGGDEQNQIILLNDAAAALEDSNPELSKSLTAFANEKEKNWEDSNANKDTIVAPLISKDIPRLRGRVRIVKEAAHDMQPFYPLIATGLNRMAKDMEKSIEMIK